MSIAHLIAVVCFLAAAIIAGFQRSWAVMAIAVGFVVLLIDGSGLIHA